MGSSKFSIKVLLIIDLTQFFFCSQGKKFTKFDILMCHNTLGLS